MATPIVIGVPDALDAPVDPAVVAPLEDAVVAVVGLDDDLVDEPQAASKGTARATTPTSAEAPRHRPLLLAAIATVRPDFKRDNFFPSP
jgi:hypothetical protein